MITKLVAEDLDIEIQARARQEPSLRGFAYVVPKLENLGPALCAALASFIEIGDVPQRIVVLPRQRLLERRVPGTWPSFPRWKITPESILIYTTKHLLSAKLQGRRLEVTITPLDQIVTTQLGTILLFSWFEWSWTNAGKLETCRVHFNTVGDWIFRDLQQCLSRIMAQHAGLDMVPISQGLQHLEKLPFKFRNIIPLHMLLPEEELQAVVYRAGLWEPRVIFLRKQTSPATALILTNSQVIVAEEAPGLAEGHYGVVARYMPRHALHRVYLGEQGEGLLLCITLQVKGVEFEQRLRFTQGERPQLDRLIALLDQPV
jgi:hypothetical protein